VAKAKYVAKANTPFSDKDAKKIGPILERIVGQANPAKVPDAIVEQARDVSSPLHRYFEWNDSKAAHKHRLDQARTMIRSIEIVRTDTRGSEQRIRAIEHVKGVGYASTNEILKSVDQTKNLLERFMSEVDALTRRWEAYAHLPEVAAVLGAIKKAHAAKKAA
jgi:hypothetical protein